MYYADASDVNYDNNTSATANAICVEIEKDDERRELNSRDQDDEDGYVSTLGCDADGNYVIAGFEANTCDGNYFSDIIDTFDQYNKQHDSVGCHQIWGRHKKNSYSNLEFLLTNSWSCDLDLYPNGCPDPYGEKERWDYAIRTVAHGGNARLAYKNMIYKRPLRIVSWIFAVVATITLVASYLIRNRDRIRSKGGKHKGVLRCLLEDCLSHAIAFRNGVKKAVRAQRENLRRQRKRRRAKKGVDASTPGEVDEYEPSSEYAPELIAGEGREKKRRRSKKQQREDKRAAATQEKKDVVTKESDASKWTTLEHDPDWANIDDDDARMV